MSPDSSFMPRVLVVEDDPDFASLISIILRDGGYSVTTARDGEEAMDEVSRSIPDLITLDLQLPRASGAHFYCQIRSKDEYQRIPIIVITGLRASQEADFVIRSFLGGEGRAAPDAYFDKPFSRHELVRTVEYCLHRCHRDDSH